MRVCIENATGWLIESQSGGDGQEDLDVLLQNAINAGYTPDDVEVKYIDDADLVTLVESTDAADPGIVKAKEIQSLVNDLKSSLVWQFRMIQALWEVGKTKGIWSNTDIADTELKAKYVEWKTKLDRLKELGE